MRRDAGHEPDDAGGCEQRGAQRSDRRKRHQHRAQRDDDHHDHDDSGQNVHARPELARGQVVRDVDAVARDHEVAEQPDRRDDRPRDRGDGQQPREVDRRTRPRVGEIELRRRGEDRDEREDVRGRTARPADDRGREGAMPPLRPAREQPVRHAVDHDADDHGDEHPGDAGDRVELVAVEPRSVHSATVYPCRSRLWRPIITA
jgi:hypothetical protein